MITVDPYYNINMYNQFLSALENNNYPYKQYILAKPPYYFYLDIPDPFIIDYDKLPDNMSKFLINIVEASNENDEYKLQRRFTDDGIKGFNKYAMNDVLREAEQSEYSCFFNVRSREHAQELSKQIGKIYYFGKYYNKYKVCLCNNKYIKTTDAEILIEKTSSVVQMELDLNFNVFKLKDRLRKYTQTPYILEGKYYPTLNQNFKPLV